MKRKFIAIALAVCLIGVTGCSSNQAADTPAKTETVETVSVTEAASERATESEPVSDTENGVDSVSEMPKVEELTTAVQKAFDEAGIEENFDLKKAESVNIIIDDQYAILYETDMGVSLEVDAYFSDTSVKWNILSIFNNENKHNYYAYGDAATTIDIYDYKTDKLKESASKTPEQLQSEMDSKYESGQEKLENIADQAIDDISRSSNDANIEDIKKKIDTKAVLTSEGDMCIFVTNNSDTPIDDLEVQLNYKDSTGATIDVDSDGHDMVLPGYTVVSKIDAPEQFADYEIETNIELGVYPTYKNHSDKVELSSSQGTDCVIIEIVNEADIIIQEIEYVVVFYKGETISAVSYPKDVMDIQPGDKITEKQSDYGIEYDRFEVYLNQAHTF